MVETVTVCRVGRTKIGRCIKNSGHVALRLAKCKNVIIEVLMEWDSWAHKPGLTHLSLVPSPGHSVVLCVHYQ